MKKQKKAFTLVEMIVTITLLSILAAVLIPSLVSLQKSGKVKADDALLNNLESVIASGCSSSEIYPSIKELAENTEDDVIQLCYKVNGTSGRLDLYGVSMKRLTTNPLTVEQINTLLKPLKNYISSHMDSMTMQSSKYGTKIYVIKIEVGDLNNTITTSGGWADSVELVDD